MIYTYTIAYIDNVFANEILLVTFFGTRLDNVQHKMEHYLA